ncbi:MAG TPA: hypothetical protein VL404_06425 [Candidatus Eisenbacteria bacterium]|jgi:hypothetical protein|nr:hypothetical protein [Candidatus Eisenbacteria bacterium]
MSTSTRTFDRTRFPWALCLAAAAGLILEVGLFSKAYLLADRNNMAIVYKKHQVEHERLDADVVIFGESGTLSLNPAVMEREIGGAYSIRNSGVRDMGYTRVLPLMLRQYLRHQPKPRLILFNIRPDHFYLEKETLDERTLQMVRRYVDLEDLWEVSDRKIPMLKSYAQNLLPSLNYRVFIVASLPEPFRDWRNTRVDLLEPLPFRERLRRARGVLKTIEETKGHYDVQDDSEIYTPERMNAERGIGEVRRDRVYPSSREVERVIAMAQERGIPVIYYLIPVNPYRANWARETRYFENVEARLDEFEKKYPCFTYFRVADFGYDADLFADRAHLNARGSEKFSRDFIRAVDPVIRRKLKGEVVQGLPPRKSWE